MISISNKEGKDNSIEIQQSYLGIISWKAMLDYKKIVEDEIIELVNSTSREEIWDLCNGKFTATTISKELGKSQQYISKEIAPWINKGIIFEQKIGSQKFLFSVDHIVKTIANSIKWKNLSLGNNE